MLDVLCKGQFTAAHTNPSKANCYLFRSPQRLGFTIFCIASYYTNFVAGPFLNHNQQKGEYVMEDIHETFTVSKMNSQIYTPSMRSLGEKCT